MHGGAEGRVYTPRDSPVGGGGERGAGMHSSRFSCGSGAVTRSLRFSGGGGTSINSPIFSWGRGRFSWGGAGINSPRFSWGRGGYELLEILLAVFIVLYVSLCTLSIFSSHPSQGNTPGDHEWVSVISSLSRLGDIGEHFDFKLHLTLIRILF